MQVPKQPWKGVIHGHYLRDAPTHDRALPIGIDKTACSGFATVGNVGLGWLTGQI